MRKWHRWLSVFFGVVLIWVTVTGVLHYVAVWWPVDPPSAEAAAAMEPPAGFVCPEGWRCTPPRAETGFWLRDNLGLIHHLHGGMEGGIWGEIIVMLSGLALLFFCISGMWMYVQLYAARKTKGLKNKLFWK
ncbi:PepSY domain-containing protein [Aurantiacibacter sp. MUD11]|uniref:PepSY domain-containing protein n=1 Tax=Aurantiacibacter sp. MUD11 TaxID=3003265 RepID=UPI0022AAABE7|nr:PepSY domain-containing protein [Aurantiacibacter sp. MUD11]WAT16908.1 PepSY domain-containing protein [Aurantiacibacter sp. MUD11]